MTHEERARAYWENFWSGGEAGAATGFYAPTFLLNGEETTAAGWTEGALRWRALFEGFTATVERVFPIADGVVTRVTYRARQVGDIGPVPASGREIEITGLDVFRFEDGRCVEHLHEADHSTMFEQLGAPPAPTA